MIKDNLLVQCGLPQLRFLGKGMESTVYEFDENTIVKIYDSSVSYDSIVRLKTFYDSLNTNEVNFHTPTIFDVANANGRVVVKEKKLFGKSINKEYLQSLSIEKLKIYFDNYLDTLFLIQKVKTDFIHSAELVDHSGKFFRNKKYMSWKELLIESLQSRYLESKRLFEREIDAADSLVDRLIAKIKQREQKNNSLIHGDFCPANTMVDDQLNITSIVDFGILTTVGDAMFDIALGLAFSDMYNEITTLNIKDYLKENLKNRLTEDEYLWIDLYVVYYSFVSAKMYTYNDPNKGHLKWCLKNLNDSSLTSGLLSE